MNYNLSYNFDSQLNCGIICVNDKRILIDFTDIFSIINFDKKFTHYNPQENPYPYYLRNNQKISFLEHLFKYDPSNIEYIYKNNNIYDLRRHNIEIVHTAHKFITSQYSVIEFNLGHFSTIGTDAYVIKNPMWKVNDNGLEFWIMYCESYSFCKLCTISYQKILDYEQLNNKKQTFFKHANGYICSTTGLYIHQIITGCFGNGKNVKNICVEHIDQNPLNNFFNNLKIYSNKNQEIKNNSNKDETKRTRKTNAKPLPEGITQDMLKKYVVFYEDYSDKEKKRLRQYFKIEKHPKLTKIWIGCKSNKLTIQQKLEEANKIAQELEQQ